MAFIQEKCSFCDNMALYDGKTKQGPWAYMCKIHFQMYGRNTPGLYTELQPNNATKKCLFCKKELPLTAFDRYRDSESGIERMRNECKQCNIKLRR